MKMSFYSGVFEVRRIDWMEIPLSMKVQVGTGFYGEDSLALTSSATSAYWKHQICVVFFSFARVSFLYSMAMHKSWAVLFTILVGTCLLNGFELSRNPKTTKKGLSRRVRTYLCSDDQKGEIMSALSSASGLASRISHIMASAGDTQDWLELRMLFHLRHQDMVCFLSLSPFSCQNINHLLLVGPDTSLSISRVHAENWRPVVNTLISLGLLRPLANRCIRRVSAHSVRQFSA